MNRIRLDDSELVSLYMKGNEEVLETLFDRHKKRLYVSIFSVIKNRCCAEDIMQETYMKVIDGLRSGKYNEKGNFLFWVLRIARNLSIDYYRKSKRVPTVAMESSHRIFNSLEFSEPSTAHNYLETQQHAMTLALLNTYIQMLPAPQREVLVMRHYMDMSFKDIANFSNVPINTSIGRMRYALINLRKKMSERKKLHRGGGECERVA